MNGYVRSDEEFVVVVCFVVDYMVVVLEFIVVKEDVCRVW